MVMALSRISKNLKELEDIRPKVRIEGLGVKFDLVVINYEKTVGLLKVSSKLNIEMSSNDFFVITESLGEVAVIASSKNITRVERLAEAKFKSKFTDAIAITLRFSEYYIKVPNVLYVFVSSLAVKRINILEIVSTLTEVSLILHKKDMDEAVDVFKQFL